MDNAEYDYLYKLLILGDCGVGKSSLMLRFADNTYKESFISNMGIDFKIKTIEIDQKIFKLQIWDTAGQERFRTITSSFYRETHGVILVFDLTDRDSFMNLSHWINEIEKHAPDEVKMLLVGSKSDLIDTRAVAYEEAKQMADSLGLEYIETSAKNDTGVEESFVKLTKIMNCKIATSNNASESIVITCQYPNCNLKAELSCSCVAPSFIVCSNHCENHMSQDTSKIHSMTSL